MRTSLALVLAMASIIGCAHAQGLGQPPYYGSPQIGGSGSFSVPGYQATPNLAGGGSYTVTPTYEPPTQTYVPQANYPTYLPPGQSPTFGYR